MLPVPSLLALAAAAGAATLVGCGLVALLLYPWLPRDLGGAPNLNARARRVKIPVGAESLDGWWLPGTRPAAVLVLHGYGRDHHRAWRYGTFLHAAGFGVLAVDFRSSRAIASGPRKPTTLGHHEIADAEASLAWLRAEPEAAGCAIGLLGESLGGSVALIAAARHAEVEAVVVDGAFASGALAIEDASVRWARLPRQPTARIARWVGRTFTGLDPGAMDAEGAMQSLAARPLLFIHGVRDNRLSEDQVQRLWRAAGAKDPLWIIPEAGHNEGWKYRGAEYEARVLAFFERYLVGASGATA